MTFKDASTPQCQNDADYGNYVTTRPPTVYKIITLKSSFNCVNMTNMKPFKQIKNGMNFDKRIAKIK